ncbi:MAG: SRPBCC domain-containing protein, partial [Gammaproteobacteria bacterium]|nr:SRPBCC domain-containing protein [Gammaproteobacteria bacterium]
MQIQLSKKFTVKAQIQLVWNFMQDVHQLASCMPGAQIEEKIQENVYKGVISSKIGPSVMRFSGTVEVLPGAHPYELRILGKGGDTGGSTASLELLVRVTENAEDVLVEGEAKVAVTGKLAQFGNRLLLPISHSL